MPAEKNPSAIWSSLLPICADKTGVELNLNDALRDWYQQHFGSDAYQSLLISDDRSPFLDAVFCQNAIEEVHVQYNVEWSYGGYLEDRSFIWKGSYMEGGKKFCHLGIDINLPPKTCVVAPWDARVLRIDDDYDLEGGWGPRIFLEPVGNPNSEVLLLAHLADVLPSAGDMVTQAAPLAVIGGAPFNGNWYPHIHIQAISREMFEQLKNTDFKELDGYTTSTSLASNHFPDPKLMLVSQQNR